MTKVNYIPMWEKQDVYNYIQGQLREQELDGTQVTINVYQIERDSEEYDIKYFEVYTSQFFFDKDDTLDNFQDDIIRTEKITKEYKTQKGLVNRLIKHQHEVMEFEYNLMSIL